MNADQREQVRSNALYLRNVRPLDPEEIAGYVEGQPHPAAVRQVLREEALDLGVVETDEGTFRPAPTGPLSVDLDGVDGLPERYARVLEDRLVDEYGPGWPDGEAGDRLRARIREVKERYHRGLDVEYDLYTALAYAVYHLPDYYAAAQSLLADLAGDGLLPLQARILDVGAGVGGPALGLLDLYPEDALVEYHAVEPSGAADLLEELLAETGPNVHATVHRTTAEDFDPEGVRDPTLAGEDSRTFAEEDGRTFAEEDGRTLADEGFDVVLFANVLSELAEPASTLGAYLHHLAADGTLVALAPADRNTATQLREVERAVADDGPATVYAPTVRLWPGASPTSESWSFDVRPDVAVPGFQQRLDDAATDPDHEPGEFVNVDVQFAYSVLRRDDRRVIAYEPDRGSVARMADAEDYVTERVDLVAVKLSHDLADEGNPLFLLGDGSQSTDHFAVLTERSTLNEALEGAAYGDLLAFEHALVLWNDDEEGYNVVVDGETIVDRVPTRPGP